MMRIKLSIFLVTLALIIPTYSIADSGKILKTKKDLSHRSKKLGAYKALVVGIDNYEDPQISNLKTAVNDAKEIGELLEIKYGFTINLLLDSHATKAAIVRNLRKMATSTNANENILIYFAGHGELDKVFNDGWWIPWDAKGGEPTTYLDNTIIQKALKAMKARHVLLISDSCYSGTLFGQDRSLPQVIDDRYYLSLYNEKSRWGMTSGNKTPVSDSGSEGHSVFAYQLIKTLKINQKPYITTQEIYTQIAHVIANNSGQTPLCKPIRNTGDQGGGFVFVINTLSYSPNNKEQPKIDLPKESKTKFDDILKAEKAQREAREKWATWQADRVSDYQKVKEIDNSRYLTSMQKQEAWQRFLASISQNNPYSAKDDDMRSHASTKLEYLKQKSEEEYKKNENNQNSHTLKYVINHKATGSTPVSIRSVTLKLSETRISFEIMRNVNNVCWNMKGSNAPYLTVTNNSVKHKIVNSNNITVCPIRRNYNKDDIFTLVFEPLPLLTESFNLIEGEKGASFAKGYWNFLNVALK